jgi:hypothetical protein
VRREFDGVLSRFAAGSLRVTMNDPASGKPRTVALARESYVEHLRLMLYTTFGARFVPLVIHQAYLGNFVPFETIALRYDAGAALARGMYFSVTCSEDVPFITPQQISDETRGTFLGDRRIRAHQAACAEWPRAEVPSDFLQPVSGPIPAVFFSGDADGATPPWLASAAVTFLTNGRQILVPHTGHQLAGPCSWGLMRDFIDRPSARELEASCTAGTKRPPFATEIPR